MPSHNFYKAQPYVQEFCEKHGLEYIQKPIYTAFADIVRSMKDSGEIWLEAKKEKQQWTTECSHYKDTFIFDMWTLINGVNYELCMIYVLLLLSIPIWLDDFDSVSKYF